MQANAVAIPADRTPALTIDSIASAFFSGRNANTIRVYRQALQDFSEYIQTDRIETAARMFLSRSAGEANAMVYAYKNDLLQRGLAPETVNKRLTPLRSLVKLARTFGLISWAIEIDNVRASSYRDTRGPGLAGVRLIMDQVKAAPERKAIRDAAIIHLLFDMGLRRGEVVKMDADSIDLKQSRLTVTRKGRTQATTLTMPARTREAVTAWLDIRGDEPGPMFTNFDRAGKGQRLSGTSIYRIVRDYGKSAGVKARPHGLRHTAITEAVKRAQDAGIKLEEVMDFSGHKNVTTLMIYRDRENDMQGQLAEMVAQAV